MNKSLKLTCLLLVFVSGCASTVPVSETPEIVLTQNAVAELKAAGNLDCETLLDECALVVEEQDKAIQTQQLVIKKQDELIAAKDEQIDSEAAAKNRATGVAAGGILAFLLLLLL